MAGVVDTNILLYAVNRDDAWHEAAREFLYGAAQSSDVWYFTEGILYEFLRVTTHARVFDQPLSWYQAIAFLQPFLESDRFDIIGAESGHWRVLQDLLATLTHPAGNLFFDIRTATLMLEHGVRRIYTTDTDFLQFRGLEVVNPLSTPNSRISEPAFRESILLFGFRSVMLVPCATAIRSILHPRSLAGK